MITIIWAFWTHRNNIIFNDAKSKPVVMLELARSISHETFVYGNCTASNILHADKKSLFKDGLLLHKSGSNII